MRRLTYAGISLGLLPLISCLSGCPETPVNPFILDIIPPTFLQQHIPDAYTVKLTYSEDIYLHHMPLLTTTSEESAIPIESWESLNNEVLITLQNPMTPGELYHVETVVYDQKNNSLGSMVPVYGYNSRVPKLLITEFTVKGNGKTRPETVELYAQTSGNLAGVTIHNSRYRAMQYYIFPNHEVEAGQYILLHYRTTEDETEIDELIAPDTSTAPNTHPEAWDFWVSNFELPLHVPAPDEGLSESNGTLALHTSPYGPIIDAVIYSKDAESNSYNGFGCEEVLTHATEIIQAGAWISHVPQAPEIIAQDVAVIGKSTTTRSIQRKQGEPDNGLEPQHPLWVDTNSPDDWYIVPTGGLSFGAP